MCDQHPYNSLTIVGPIAYQDSQNILQVWIQCKISIKKFAVLVLVVDILSVSTTQPEFLIKLFAMYHVQLLAVKKTF